ncbi:hypothetical protein F4805DRAFT_411759 [Annulohypoxylon moriforme]|nr:hypothetical protein F4805DRAFT_411759 [Annulohypoxylon moriforme]
MEHLAALTNEGLFDEDRETAPHHAWLRLLSEVNAFFPTRFWTVESMKAKHKTEKKRWLEYETLINNYTRGHGVSGLDETGCPVVSDRQWNRFIKNHPTAKWLRSSPLGDDEIYYQAFGKDESTGAYIRAAGEEGDITLGERSSRQADDSFPYPLQNQRSIHRQQKRQYDPDLIEVSNDSNTKPIPPRKKKVAEKDISRQALAKRETKKNRGLDTTGFERTFIEISHKMGREPGSSDIEKAFIYLQEYLVGDMDDDQFLLACDVLQKPLVAVGFNTLSAKYKLRYLHNQMNKAAHGDSV